MKPGRSLAHAGAGCQIWSRNNGAVAVGADPNPWPFHRNHDGPAVASVSPNAGYHCAPIFGAGRRAPGQLGKKAIPPGRQIASTVDWEQRFCVCKMEFCHCLPACRHGLKMAGIRPGVVVLRGPTPPLGRIPTVRLLESAKTVHSFGTLLFGPSTVSDTGMCFCIRCHRLGDHCQPLGPFE